MMKRTVATIAYAYSAIMGLRIIWAATEPGSDFPHPFAISIIAALWGGFCALAALSLVIDSLMNLAKRIKGRGKL